MKRLKYIFLYKQKYILYILIILLVLSLLKMTFIKKKSIYNNQTEFNCIINKITTYEDKTKYVISCPEKVIGVLYKINNDFKLGDNVKINGSLKEPNKKTVFNIFDYKEYLYNNDIFYILEISDIELIKENKNIVYKIRNNLKNYISSFKSSSYLNAFILGDKTSFDDDILDSYIDNGISHLISISGMHVSIFCAILLFILKRLTYNVKIIYVSIILFIIFYMSLTGFMPSLVRCGIMYILSFINKMFDFKIKKINIIYLTLIIILLINPYFLYNIGFVLSYVITLSICLCQKYINRFSNYFIKIFIISLVSFLVSFPIIITNYFSINLLSIIINIIFVPIVSIIIGPLSIITLILPFLDTILYFFIDILNGLSLWCSNIKILTIIFSKPSLILVILYYLSLFFAIKNIKYIIFFIMLVIFNKLIPYLNFNMEITMLDVGQGDSILIRYPYNKNNVLIDTGGTFYYEFSESTLLPYFKSLGISTINYLIITHGDLDHIGSSINLVKKFNIKNVVFNNGSYNSLEKKLITELENEKINYFKMIDKININNNVIYNLNNKIYDNENENSLVLYFKYLDYNLLFMGDATIKNEEDILKKYSIKNIDIFKVGHHGSKTSSKLEFINQINPKVSLISVGLNNKFGHPNKEIIENLKKSQIFRTDSDGSVMLNFKKNKIEIKTCL